MSSESPWITERVCEFDPAKLDLATLELRQKDLPLARYDSVAIAGLGGVGSWVAFFLALSRRVGKLELVDFDYLEPHNLNRTPYRPGDVCGLKTSALRELLSSVNPGLEVVVYPYPLEKVVDRLESSVLVEATDSLKLGDVLEEWVRRGNVLVRAHYDGEHFSISVNHVPKWSYGSGEAGYSTAPVYVGTPVVLAGLTVHVLLWRDLGLSLKDEGFFFSGSLSGLLGGGVKWDR